MDSCSLDALQSQLYKVAAGSGGLRNPGKFGMHARTSKGMLAKPSSAIGSVQIRANMPPSQISKPQIASLRSTKAISNQVLANGKTMGSSLPQAKAAVVLLKIAASRWKQEMEARQAAGTLGSAPPELQQALAEKRVGQQTYNRFKRTGDLPLAGKNSPEALQRSGEQAFGGSRQAPKPLASTTSVADPRQYTPHQAERLNTFRQQRLQSILRGQKNLAAQYALESAWARAPMYGPVQSTRSKLMGRARRIGGKIGFGAKVLGAGSVLAGGATTAAVLKSQIGRQMRQTAFRPTRQVVHGAGLRNIVQDARRPAGWSGPYHTIKGSRVHRVRSPVDG